MGGSCVAVAASCGLELLRPTLAGRPASRPFAACSRPRIVCDPDNPLSHCVTSAAASPVQELAWCLREGTNDNIAAGPAHWHKTSSRMRSTAGLLCLLLFAGHLGLSATSSEDGTLPGVAARLHTALSASHVDTLPVHTIIPAAASLDAVEKNGSTASPLQGPVHDCCNCTFDAVNKINDQVVHPILTQLVQTAFFRYFKANIHCDCPLWPDDGMCMLKACSVCVCDKAEVPQPWLAAEEHDCARRQATLGQCDNVQCGAEMASAVDRDVDPQMQARLLNLKGWRGYNNPWMAEGEEDEGYEYINLLANPERYTGYSGTHPHRIWRTIYGQPVFAQLDSLEKTVFYRLISGMHASISAHLSAKYLLDQQQDVWGPNYHEFQVRLGNPDVQDRVANLYFSYLFVLAAVEKAAPQLESFAYDTGVPEEDELASRLIRELVRNKSIEASCPRPFDEGRLWQGESSQQLRVQLQQTFQNITQVMDCVGCEKCKLWGKLQTLGIATALKILFGATEGPGEGASEQLHLERNEVIALVNLLERFSSSIDFYQTMSKEVKRRGGVTAVRAPPTLFNMFSP